MYLLRPERVLFYGWMVWLSFLIISPYDYYNLGNFVYSIVTLFLFNISLVLGMKSNRFALKRTKLKPIVFNSNISKLLIMTTILSIVGSILYIYTKLEIIGSINFSSLASNKIEIFKAGEQANSLLKALSVFLHPFSIVSFILLIYFRNNFSRTKFLIILSLSLITVFFQLILGSRTLLFFYFFLGLIVMVISPKSHLRHNLVSFTFKSLFSKISKRVIILCFLALIGVFKIFTWIQDDRLESMGGDNVSFFNYWAEGQQWNYNSDHPINFLMTEHPSYYSGGLNFIHYQVHGVYEYSRNISHLGNPEGTYYGAYELYPIIKLLNFIGFESKLSDIEMNKVVLRHGVYSTFWGPFYIDFGLFGIVVILLAD